jgi:hypothetical protein
VPLPACSRSTPVCVHVHPPRQQRRESPPVRPSARVRRRVTTRPTVCRVTQDKLPDRWHSRDYPVLLEAARLLDAGEMPVSSDDIAANTGLDEDDVVAALEALHGTFTTGQALNSLGGPMGFFIGGLTERGRRATGLWPDEEHAADALIELLTKAGDEVSDEEDSSALKRAGRLLRCVPASVLADVTAALIRQQAGLN